MVHEPSSRHGRCVEHHRRLGTRRSASAASPSTTATRSAPTRSCATATAIAQVEDVVVLEGHRGNGLGRLVTTAALAAGLALEPELMFIVADDDDWPKELYARLGFEPGRPHADVPPPAARAVTAALGLGPPPAGEVARVAQVAQERRVGDGARVPRPGGVGRDRGGKVGAPVRAAGVELGELVGRERPPRRLRSSASIRVTTSSSAGRCSSGAPASRRSPSRHCPSAVSKLVATGGQATRGARAALPLVAGSPRIT